MPTPSLPPIVRGSVVQRCGNLIDEKLCNHLMADLGEMDAVRLQMSRA